MGNEQQEFRICSIELPNAEVSDTTGDDRSNVAGDIIIINSFKYSLKINGLIFVVYRAIFVSLD
jgi:hypothetical protein